MGWRDGSISLRAFMMLVAIVPTAAMAAVAALRHMTMFGEWQSLSSATIVFVGAWHLLLAGGILLGGLATLPPRRATLVESISVNKIVAGMSVLALLGACLLTYEFAIERSYGFDTPINDIRVGEVNRAVNGFVGSWLGGLGRVLVAALTVAWVAACMRWAELRWRSLAAMAFCTVGVFAYQAKFEGGRFFFTAMLLACLFASVLHFAKQSAAKGGVISLRSLRAVHLQPIVLLVALFVGIWSYNSYVFVSRGEYAATKIESQPNGGSPGSAAQGAAQTEGERYAAIYKRFAAYFPIDTRMVDAGSFDRTRLQMAMGWIYVTHGLSHFDLVINQDDFVFGYGSFQFSQLAQVASKLLGRNLRYIGNLPIDGTYVTLAGAAYVDFGLIPGLLFAVVLGVALGCTVSVALSRQGSVLEFVAPILFAVLLFAPVSSIIPSLWPSVAWIMVIYIIERSELFQVPGRILGARGSERR